MLVLDRLTSSAVGRMCAVREEERVSIPPSVCRLLNADVALTLNFQRNVTTSTGRTLIRNNALNNHLENLQ